MRPPCAVLIDALPAAWKYLGAVDVAQLQDFGCCVINVACGAPSGCSARYRSTGSMNWSYVGTGIVLQCSLLLSV